MNIILQFTQTKETIQAMYKYKHEGDFGYILSNLNFCFSASTNASSRTILKDVDSWSLDGVGV